MGNVTGQYVELFIKLNEGLRPYCNFYHRHIIYYNATWWLLGM